MSVVVYRIPQVSLLVAPSPGAARHMNLPQYRADFRLFRYIDNEVDFLIRDIDRKIPCLSDIGSVMLYLTDPLTKKGIFARQLALVDITQGLFKLYMTGKEVEELPYNALSYVVVYTRTDGVEQVMYTDLYNKQSGDVEIASGPVPPPIAPQTILTSNMLTDNNGNLFTGPLVGGVQVGNTCGAHSFMFPLTWFTGVLKVYASLSTEPDLSDSSWFQIATYTATLETDNRYLGMVGNYVWLKLVITVTTGTIGTILYRN